jgi:hypothetical protein
MSAEAMLQQLSVPQLAITLQLVPRKIKEQACGVGKRYCLCRLRVSWAPSDNNVVFAILDSFKNPFSAI